MHWDDIAAQYELVDLRSFLDGQVVVGYPPSVGSVDVNLTRASILSGSHLIGRVSPTGGEPWTFAIEWLFEDEILPLPGSRRLMLGEWMIDLDAPGRLVNAPIAPLRGSIPGPDGAVFLWGLYEVIRLERGGLQWKSQGLFGGDLTSVVLREGGLACLGPLDWIEPGRQFTLLLDPTTGRIAGGDPEAVEAHDAAR